MFSMIDLMVVHLALDASIATMMSLNASSLRIAMQGTENACVHQVSAETTVQSHCAALFQMVKIGLPDPITKLRVNVKRVGLVSTVMSVRPTKHAML